jgi:quercetin dioxygenase-like cupin family protein
MRLGMAGVDVPTFAEFEAAARAEGYDEILVREWAADAETGEHSHPFDASLRVVRGEVVLTMAGVTRRFLAGDTCKVPRGEVHSEVYGREGATIWVARAN